MLRRRPLHIYGHAHFGTEHVRVSRRAWQISRGAVQKDCLRDRPVGKGHFKTSGRPRHRPEHGWWLFLRHDLRTKETLIARTASTPKDVFREIDSGSLLNLLYQPVFRAKHGGGPVDGPELHQ